MANLNDLLDHLGLEGEPGVQLAGDLLGVLADLSGTIGFLQLTGFLSVDDKLQGTLSAIYDDLNQISQLVQQLEGQVATSDKLQRMRDIDQGIGHAVAVFQQLPAILTAVPSPTEDFKLTQIQTCLEAVLFFTDFDDKWQVVGADLPYFTDAWSGELAPAASSDGLVFNYTYTLPQFLRSINILLAAIRALQPSSLNKYADVLSRAVNRLESIHQTIVQSGIVGTRAPGAGDLGSVVTSADDRGDTLGPPNWIGQGGLYPYGAVEIYSGANNVGSYTTFFDFSGIDMTVWNETQATNFLNLVRLQIERQKKALYASLGMPALRKIIDQLRQLTGQPPLADPLYSAWSYTDVLSILGLTLPPPAGLRHPFGEPRGLEDTLRAFLLTTPPFIEFPVYSGGGSFRTQAPIPLPSGSLYTFLTGASFGPIAMPATHLTQ